MIFEITYASLMFIAFVILQVTVSYNEKGLQLLTNRQSNDHRENSNDFRRENYVLHERIDIQAKQIERLESIVYTKTNKDK